MGIKDLWTILRPFGERKPLFELQGKTVAIDLSCWVCDSQNVLEYVVQPHMYLRNLYFRTCYLLLLGVNPVFVLEGKAPTLKYKTIASRNAHQFKGSKPKTDKSKPCKDRTRFNFTLKLCEEMLKYMGLVCLKGNGEAEAVCAYLNENQFVAGCITQDSDCFAYGARTVYRNFSISQQGLYSASGGAVDEYDIKKLEDSNGIGRNKIIAMALLCGSDYSDGVSGVGKDSVLKLFDGISDNEILDRMRSWRAKSDYYEDLQKQMVVKNVCTTCGHSGKLIVHEKNGCRKCGTSQDCLATNWKEKQLFNKNEVNIRKKALESPDFPNEELINEYLSNKQSIRDLNVQWQRPDIIKFVELMKKHLQWQEVYTFEKFLPLITRWQLLKNSKLKDVNSAKYARDVFKPNYIKKKRIPKGIPSYEIIWSDVDDILKRLIPEDQLEVTFEKLLATIEPQQLVEEAYPTLVETYNSHKIKAKNIPKRKQKVQGNARVQKKKNKTETKVSKACDVLNRLDLNDDGQTGKQTKINTYFQNTRSSGKNQLTGLSDLDLSHFGDEDDFDVSDIVESIVNYEQPKYIEENLQKMQKNILKHHTHPENHETSFFEISSTAVDLFEQTFTKLDFSSSSEDSAFSE